MALYGGFIHKNNSGKFMGRRVGHRRCRIVSGIKNKNMKNSLMIKWFTGRRLCQISQTILHGRDAILRVRDKLLISNIILQLWADVKYHVPTGFFVVKRRAVFILSASPKGCFLCFLFRCPQYLFTEPCQPFLYSRPKEPSLWFVVWGRGLNQPRHITNAALPARSVVSPKG